ncbi:hypothetical protein D3C83_186030 [compost metagenome]
MRNDNTAIGVSSPIDPTGSCDCVAVGLMTVSHSSALMPNSFWNVGSMPDDSRMNLAAALRSWSSLFHTRTTFSVIHSL